MRPITRVFYRRRPPSMGGAATRWARVSFPAGRARSRLWSRMEVGNEEGSCVWFDWRPGNRRGDLAAVQAPAGAAGRTSRPGAGARRTRRPWRSRRTAAAANRPAPRFPHLRTRPGSRSERRWTPSSPTSASSSATGTVIENGHITVRGGKIAEVAAGAPASTQGLRVLNAQGMTAMPGLHRRPQAPERRVPGRGAGALAARGRLHDDPRQRPGAGHRCAGRQSRQDGNQRAAHHPVRRGEPAADAGRGARAGADARRRWASRTPPRSSSRRSRRRRRPKSRRSARSSTKPRRSACR